MGKGKQCWFNPESKEEEKEKERRPRWEKERGLGVI